jgi:hypothetical protein
MTTATLNGAAGTSHRKELIRIAAAMPGTFSLDELIIAAWQADPVRFGMFEHPQYPDSHRVKYYCYGVAGLIHTGHLKKLGGGRYSYISESLLERCLRLEAVTLPLVDVTLAQARELWGQADGPTDSDRADDLKRQLRVQDDDPKARLVLNRSDCLFVRYERRLGVA